MALTNKTPESTATPESPTGSDIQKHMMLKFTGCCLCKKTSKHYLCLMQEDGPGEWPKHTENICNQCEVFDENDNLRGKGTWTWVPKKHTFPITRSDSKPDNNDSDNEFDRDPGGALISPTVGVPVQKLVYKAQEYEPLAWIETWRPGVIEPKSPWKCSGLQTNIYSLFYLNISIKIVSQFLISHGMGEGGHFTETWCTMSVIGSHGFYRWQPRMNTIHDTDLNRVKSRWLSLDSTPSHEHINKPPWFPSSPPSQSLSCISLFTSFLSFQLQVQPQLLHTFFTCLSIVRERS